MHSVNYYTRSPPDVHDSRIEELNALSKMLETLDKPDRTVSTSRTVSLWINQSEKKSRTVSLWINQSEKVPCQRDRKRDKPARQKNRRGTVSTFIEKRDKPGLKKICYILNGEFFCLTMKSLLKKFRTSQTRFSRKSRKIPLQSRRISKRRTDRCCIDERRESILCRKEKIFTNRTKLCCFKSLVISLGGGYLNLDGIELRYQNDAS